MVNNAFRRHMNFTPVFIITGEQGAGKSAFAGQLSSILKNRQYTVKGIIAKGIWKNNLRTGFELTDPSGVKSFFLAERIYLPSAYQWPVQYWLPLVVLMIAFFQIWLNTLKNEQNSPER